MTMLATTALALVVALSGGWRAMTEAELKAAIPERASVEAERIETELRTASGVVDAKGRVVAGVVLITAGYSADGKYTHFLTTQAPVTIDEVTLAPGEYVFAHRATPEDALQVYFYDAKTGRLVGAAMARRATKSGPIRSFALLPQEDGSVRFMIGRFAARCTITN
jgi:glycine/D-amino acid oxidase-like deaminating enzyme